MSKLKFKKPKQIYESVQRLSNVVLKNHNKKDNHDLNKYDSIGKSDIE